MKLSACVEWLFEDVAETIPERITAAKQTGLYGVEFHLWRDKPVDDIERALGETGMTLTSFCVDPRRSIVDKTQKSEFLQAIKDSVAPAKQLRCNQLIIASGFNIEGLSHEEHMALAHASLKEAALIAEDNGLVLLLEPLNTKVDHPGMFLNSVSDGLNLVEAIASPGLKLVYDAYHSIVMGDDITTVLKGRMEHVGHIQVADMPGRGTPGTGEIDWSKVVSVFQEEGYQGAIGLEYKLNGLSSSESIAMAQKNLQA